MQVVERDFFADRLREAELRALIGDTLPADAFAWRSPRVAQMGLDSRNPPPETELVRLMLEIPYLLKRPVIRLGGATVFGFDREKIESLTS